MMLEQIEHTQLRLKIKGKVFKANDETYEKPNIGIIFECHRFLLCKPIEFWLFSMKVWQGLPQISSRF